MTAQQQHRKLEEAIPLPTGVEATINGRNILIKGKCGSVEKRCANPFTTITKQNNTILLTTSNNTRKSKRMLYTIKSHITNMIIGVQQGFTYKLKICSGHFPITVKVEGDRFVVSNFLGEKIPRKATILPNVTVKVDRDVITVHAADLEAAGQTAANIEKLTDVGKRDRRVFQDGCYITEKPGRVFS